MTEFVILFKIIQIHLVKWKVKCHCIIVLLCSMWPHAATYCIIIQMQRMQISGRNSNGTKQSGGPLEDGREKRQKHVGVLYLRTCF
jgi:hypothetical protein